MFRVIYLTEQYTYGDEGNAPSYTHVCPSPNTIEKDGLVLCDALVKSLEGITNILGAWRTNGVPVIELNEPVYLEYLSPVIEYDENGDEISSYPRSLEEVHNWGWVHPSWSISDMSQEQQDWLNSYIENGISEYRDILIHIEVSTELSDGRTVVLKNDDRTKTALLSKKNTINNENSITTMAFEARNGWFDLTYSDYQDLEVSLDLFTQNIFDGTRVIMSNHNDTPYLILEDAMSDLDDIVGGS